MPIASANRERAVKVAINISRLSAIHLNRKKKRKERKNYFRLSWLGISIPSFPLFNFYFSNFFFSLRIAAIGNPSQIRSNAIKLETERNGIGPKSGTRCRLTFVPPCQLAEFKLLIECTRMNQAITLKCQSCHVQLLFALYILELICMIYVMINAQSPLSRLHLIGNGLESCLFS